MFVVDTNILLYAANSQCIEHQKCVELLETARSRRGAWYASWSILYGFVRISTHPRVLAKPWRSQQAWDFVETLLKSSGFSLLIETDRHGKVVEEILYDLPDIAGNIVSDLHIAALMKEHGIATIYTRDTDFHRFPFLKVIDPLLA
jgi:uncharacterized protein